MLAQFCLFWPTKHPLRLPYTPKFHGKLSLYWVHCEFLQYWNTPKKFGGFSWFDNVFHVYLMRGFQKYKRNWILTMAFWATYNFKTRHLQYQINFDGSSLVFSNFFSQTALKFCQLPGFDSWKSGIKWCHKEQHTWQDLSISMHQNFKMDHCTAIP